MLKEVFCPELIHAVQLGDHSFSLCIYVLFYMLLSVCECFLYGRAPTQGEADFLRKFTKLTLLVCTLVYPQIPEGQLTAV